MAIRNDAERYGSMAKFFHWFTFILVVALITVGFTAEEFAKPLRGELINIHKLMGLTVLVLTLLRLGWILINPKPLLPPLPRWEEIGMHIVQGLLYVFLLIMATSGWMMVSFAGRPPNLFGLPLAFPGISPNEQLSDLLFNIHATSVWILMGLIAIHALAALKHHYINRDMVFRRMWRG